MEDKEEIAEIESQASDVLTCMTKYYTAFWSAADPSNREKHYEDLRIKIKSELDKIAPNLVFKEELYDDEASTSKEQNLEDRTLSKGF